MQTEFDLTDTPENVDLPTGWKVYRGINRIQGYTPNIGQLILPNYLDFNPLTLATGTQIEEFQDERRIMQHTSSIEQHLVSYERVYALRRKFTLGSHFLSEMMIQSPHSKGKNTVWPSFYERLSHLEKIARATDSNEFIAPILSQGKNTLIPVVDMIIELPEPNGYTHDTLFEPYQQDFLGGIITPGLGLSLTLSVFSPHKYTDSLVQSRGEAVQLYGVEKSGSAAQLITGTNDSVTVLGMIRPLTLSELNAELTLDYQEKKELYDATWVAEYQIDPERAEQFENSYPPPVEPVLYTPGTMPTEVTSSAFVLRLHRAHRGQVSKVIKDETHQDER